MDQVPGLSAIQIFGGFMMSDISHRHVEAEYNFDLFNTGYGPSAAAFPFYSVTCLPPEAYVSFDFEFK